MYSFNPEPVSILFQHQASSAISHTILYEQDEAFQQLMNGRFNVRREGSDVFLEITSETELLNIRQIIRIPLFMKF